MPHPHRVVALALPGVILLDLAAPTHVFGHCGADRYAFEVVGVRAGPVPSSTGVEIIARRGLRALADADTVVVPGAAGIDRSDDDLTAAARAVARAHRRGARVMSVCTGAFVLAQAGVLDGRRATTHWRSAERLARRFPAVEVDRDVLYVDEGSVLTSAGVAAGLDLCLHVVRRDHGAALAGELARRTVVAPHREGGQAQFISPPTASIEPQAEDGSTEPARSWALAHLDQPLPNAALAARVAMSPRTFARRFRAEAGVTPGQWVSEQRLRAAQTLLETTDLAIERVADASGFHDAAALRAHFTRRLATTPTAYRRTFAGRRPPADDGDVQPGAARSSSEHNQ